MRLFNQDTKVNALKRAPLFQDLSRKELSHLARVSEDLEIPTGTALCKEGEIGREFFVIVEGKVEVTRGGKRVAMRGGGEFVGEIALLEQTPRTATVTAKTPLRVFVLTDKDFRDLVKESPAVERKVLRALARRVVELSRDLTVAERLDVDSSSVVRGQGAWWEGVEDVQVHAERERERSLGGPLREAAEGFWRGDHRGAAGV